MNTKTEKSNQLNIIFSSGGFRLHGVLHLPAVNRPPVVIGSHGLMANKNSPKQIALAEKCIEMGLAYFRFDARGCGESEGDYFRDTSFGARCEDLRNAVKILDSRNEVGHPIAMFGSSLGGAVSIEVAKTIRVAALVAFAAPIRSRELSAPAEQSNSENAPTIPLQFDISKDLSSIKNILIIHGEKDSIVPLSHAYEIHHAVQEPKRMIIQHKGDHAMSNEKHQKEFLNQAAQWLKTGLIPND